MTLLYAKIQQGVASSASVYHNNITRRRRRDDMAAQTPRPYIIYVGRRVARARIAAPQAAVRESVYKCIAHTRARAII